jgi:ferredoxin
MPRVTFFTEGVACEVREGENLRMVAIRHRVELYRTFHVLLNCKGKGKCGSCRVEVSDAACVEPAERTAPERRFLDEKFSDLTTRLACQVRVRADLSVLTQEVRGRKLDTGSFIPRGF